MKKGRVYKSRTGTKTSSNFVKPKYGIVRAVETIVRKMGPPRNINAIASGAVDVAAGDNNMRAGLCLIGLSAQGNGLI